MTVEEVKKDYEQKLHDLAIENLQLKTDLLRVNELTMSDMIHALIKDAHDHGYEIAASNLKWDKEKSFEEFKKQNNYYV